MCLFSSEILNFEDEIFLRGVECNIPHKFHQLYVTRLGYQI